MNKPSEAVKPFTIRLPESLYQKVRHAAWGSSPDDRVPLNTFIVNALQQALRGKDAPQPEKDSPPLGYGSRLPRPAAAIADPEEY